MALLLSNAVIHSQSDPPTGLPIPKLTATRALVDKPDPKVDLPVVGGVVHYLVVLDPGLDIVAGDTLFIDSWGAHTVNPNRPYHVFSASPEGSFGLECIRCQVGDRIGR